MGQRPFWPHAYTQLLNAPSEATGDALSLFTNGACCFLQLAREHRQDAAEAGLEVERAHQPAVCGLVTTVAPLETRNHHMLTSAPSGSVEQRADTGTGALHAYGRSTIVACPRFPLHLLARAPQEK